MEAEADSDMALPRIEDGDRAASVHQTAAVAMGRLAEAVASASRFVKVFGREPYPAFLLIGFENLEGSIAEAMAGIDEVYRELGVRRRVGRPAKPRRTTWAERQRREWAAWERHRHAASAASPAQPHLEEVEPGLTVVHLAGRRIGYLRAVTIVDPDIPGHEGDEGWEALDPFKRAYKRRLYGSVDEAVGRLAEESVPFLEAGLAKSGVVTT